MAARITMCTAIFGCRIYKGDAKRPFKKPPYTVQQPSAFSTATLSFSTATLLLQYSNPPASVLLPLPCASSATMSLWFGYFVPEIPYSRQFSMVLKGQT